MSDDEYNLECPFLTDSPDYAAGVRLGMFWAELMAGGDKVVGIVKKDEEEHHRVAATRRGYAITDRQQADPSKAEDDQDWLIVVYERTERADLLDSVRWGPNDHA